MVKARLIAVSARAPVRCLPSAMSVKAPVNSQQRRASWSATFATGPESCRRNALNVSEAGEWFARTAAAPAAEPKTRSPKNCQRPLSDPLEKSKTAANRQHLASFRQK